MRPDSTVAGPVSRQARAGSALTPRARGAAPARSCRRRRRPGAGPSSPPRDTPGGRHDGGSAASRCTRAARRTSASRVASVRTGTRWRSRTTPAGSRSRGSAPCPGPIPCSQASPPAGSSTRCEAPSVCVPPGPSAHLPPPRVLGESVWPSRGSGSAGGWQPVRLLVTSMVAQWSVAASAFGADSWAWLARGRGRALGGTGARRNARTVAPDGAAIIRAVAPSARLGPCSDCWNRSPSPDFSGP